MSPWARWLCGAVLAVLAGTSAGCADDPEASSPEPSIPCGGTATEQYAVHDGVPANFNSLDIYLPAAVDGACSGRPLVVWVHGGGWNEGDKTDDIEDKIRLFTEAGYAFASINYRLTDISIDPPAPNYPVHDQDSADAVAWLVAHAAGLGIDTHRIALLGHSAGGGIVAAITTDESFLRGHGLDLDAVRCAGSIDGEGYDVTVGATHADPFVRTTYRDAFGDDPTTWASASPMTHIAAGKGIPEYFVAARGPEMRLDLHAEFVAALRAADVSTTVLDAQSLDHGEVSVDIGTPGDTVMTPAVMDFLNGCFGPPAR